MAQPARVDGFWTVWGEVDPCEKINAPTRISTALEGRNGFGPTLTSRARPSTDRERIARAHTVHTRGIEPARSPCKTIVGEVPILSGKLVLGRSLSLSIETAYNRWLIGS
jgi:hypothetical protein